MHPSVFCDDAVIGDSSAEVLHVPHAEIPT